MDLKILVCFAIILFTIFVIWKANRRHVPAKAPSPGPAFPLSIPATPYSAGGGGSSASGLAGLGWLVFTVAVICFGVIGIYWGVQKIDQSQPVVAKTTEPTEVLYRIEIKDYAGNLKSGSGDFFRLRIKGDGYFEGYYPTTNSMDGPSCNFSQHLKPVSRGKWAGGGQSGFFEIWVSEYHPAQRETIHGWFWDEGMNPEQDRPWTITLIPKNMLVRDWTRM